MAESVHKSSDIPNFDTYPSTPSDELIDYKGVARSSIASSSIEKPSLDQRAAELGAAAGRIAAIMRETKDSIESLARHSIYGRITELAENARIRSKQLRRRTAIRIQEMTDTAQEKAAELGCQAREKTAMLGRQAKSNYDRARLKANQTVRKYPVETALAAGAVGFLIGVGLRIRRAKRAY
jgi:ElaB/YqjD/DUF883 family membrane-anchored ribosome-binding protein